MNYVLWTAQVLLALIFLFAGGMKLVVPIESMTSQMPVALPGWFLQFIGVCEVLGAIGVIVPGALRIRPGLTPVAAVGLVVIMIGATIFSVVYLGIGSGIVPFCVGLIAAFVAYGRWRLAPIGTTSRPPAVQVR